MRPDKLVMMANQIAAFFAAQGEARAVPQIADHVEKFWDPRMRRAILAHVGRGGAGLSPLNGRFFAGCRPLVVGNMAAQCLRGDDAQC